MEEKSLTKALDSDFHLPLGVTAWALSIGTGHYCAKRLKAIKKEAIEQLKNTPN